MPLLSDRTPFLALFGVEADYSIIRTFGCLAYASTPPVHRTKFDPRATPCVFMGYQAGIKGYRLYDIKKKCFLISRDVLFFEHLFPFSTIKEHEFSTATDAFFDTCVLPHALSDIATRMESTASSTNASPLTPDISVSDDFEPHEVASAQTPSAQLDTDQLGLRVTPVTPLQPSPLEVAHRRSERNHTQPTYLKDYYCNLLLDKTVDGSQTPVLKHLYCL